jgi:hypothetical protein
MKHIYIVIMIVSSLALSAQGIPIQLMVVDQNGFEMPNTQVKLRLTMRGDTSLTAGQYQEVHNVSTNDLGIVSVDFGAGITTTNSQVLGLELFSFGESEPFIKTELDTTMSPTQYRNLGWMKYSYSMVSQRALKADTADYLRDNLIYELNDAAAFNVTAGIAIPSVDSTAMNGVTSPVTGQLIYNSDLNGLLVWSSGQWKTVQAAQESNNDIKKVLNARILN